MPKVTEFLTPDDLAKLASHQMLARKVVEGFCSGMHRSPHKGFSVEFKQHRQYVPGDELRRVDWKVFARSDRTPLPTRLGFRAAGRGEDPEIPTGVRPLRYPAGLGHRGPER